MNEKLKTLWTESRLSYFPISWKKYWCSDIQITKFNINAILWWLIPKDKQMSQLQIFLEITKVAVRTYTGTFFKPLDIANEVYFWKRFFKVPIKLILYRCKSNIIHDLFYEMLLHLFLPFSDSYLSFSFTNTMLLMTNRPIHSTTKFR